MGIRLSELVDILGGTLTGDGALEVAGIAPLTEAGAAHLTFLSNPKFRSQAAATNAAALILAPADDAQIGAEYAGARIVTANPYAYFARVAQLFEQRNAPPVVPGIHPSAVVDATALVHASAVIGPLVVIEADASVGAECRIDAGCYIGRGASVGAGSHFHPRVSFLANCHIGKNGILQSGAVIGGDGFGFANEAGAWIKIPQTGGVRIGDDVEIGANTTVDRGALADTIIEDGVKLDNQIQIGHNCRIGAHTAMAGCVGVAGSAIIGKYCTFGGAAMVLGHLTIADRVHISSGSMVSRSILEAGQYTGFYPLAKNADWEKSAAIVRNLPSLREKIRALEKITKSPEEDSKK
jgi:UDP-3-O-[3-hydroxymyristoyl] glucosamine N-acyltransferase